MKYLSTTIRVIFLLLFLAACSSHPKHLKIVGKWQDKAGTNVIVRTYNEDGTYEEDSSSYRYGVLKREQSFGTYSFIDEDSPLGANFREEIRESKDRNSRVLFGLTYTVSLDGENLTIIPTGSKTGLTFQPVTSSNPTVDPVPGTPPPLLTFDQACAKAENDLSEFYLEGYLRLGKGAGKVSEDIIIDLYAVKMYRMKRHQ